MRPVRPGFLKNLFPLSAGGGAVTDPYFANVVLLAFNESGADTTTTFVDQSASAKTITAVGNAQWDAAQAPTGLTSTGLLDGTDDSWTLASSADFAFAGDLTVEVMCRFASLTGNQNIFDTRDGEPQVRPILFKQGVTNAFMLYVNGGIRITGSALAADTWYHLAWSKVSGTSRLFINGTQTGSNYTDGNSYTQGAPFIGINFAGTNDYNGWMGSLRVTKGVGRYTTTFTPPTLPLPTS